MRVLVDVDTQSAQDSDDTLRYLLGLLEDDSIVTWRFSDSGPPQDAAPIDAPWGAAVAGWITVAGDGGTINYSGEDRVVQSALRAGDIGRLVRADEYDRSYPDLSREAAAEQRFADVRLLKVAHAANIDLLITERPYLRSDPYNLVGGGITEVAHCSEALSIVGLYLRTQRRFVVDAVPTGGRSTFNKGLMTWVASRSLLPEGWRWMAACVQHSSHTGEDLLTHYAGTVHHRLERALVARDELFVALNQPQNNDSADDAMTALDNILINLSACLDVTARVYNHALGAPSPPHQVGWRREPWLKEVRKLDPSATKLIDDANFTNVTAIVGELRNTIHGAALDPIGIAKRAHLQREDTMVGLPADRLNELLAAMDTLGGRESWGVRELIPGRAHAELDVLCERLMQEVPAALNTIMTRTPVEALAGVSLDDKDRTPDEGPQSPFKERIRRNILLQYGLG